MIFEMIIVMVFPWGSVSYGQAPPGFKQDGFRSEKACMIESDRLKAAQIAYGSDVEIITLCHGYEVSWWRRWP